MVSGGRKLVLLGACVACLVARPAAAQVGSDARDAAEADNAVTPPELLEFSEAEYPPEARERGLTAAVVLALDIDAFGKVIDASVVEPAGAGFDEAAVAAARRFVFEPARRNGRPVRSRILYRYDFHLEAEPVEQARVEGVIEGRVLDADERPAANARVRLALNGRTLSELSTDADGRFEFGELAPGRYDLTIELSGASRFDVQEQLGADERISATYRLERPEPASEGIEIVVAGKRPRREVTRRPLQRRELSRIPGTSGDALRALQNLPGVARPPALSGLLAVRGNGQDTTPIFIDGLWLPTVYHFGGLSSVVPTEMLDEIDFYPGNFGVRYGRALAGVVDAHLRKTRDDGRYHGLLQLDLVDVRAMAEGPIPGASGWNFIGGFRRSHVDAWLAPLLENEDTDIQAAPVYYDYQFLIDHRPSPRSYLRIGTLGSDDRFRLIDSGSAAGGQLENVDSSVGLGVLYTQTFDERLSLDLSATVARLHQLFELSTIRAETLAWGSINRAELTWQMWDRATLRFGYDLLVAPYTVTGQLPEDPGPSAPDVGSFVTAPTRRVERSSVFLQPAVYAEFELAPNGRAELVSGVRLDYTYDTGRFDVSPRMSARYELISGFPSTTLKAGSGLFFQPPGLAETVLSRDESLRSMRSFQNSVGLEQELSERVELSVEGFFNLLDDLISRNPDETGALAYDNAGTGRIFGAELMLRYKADEDLFGWLSYTLSRSERTWAPGEPSRLYYLDQTHILTALASYRLGRGWEVGGRFRYVTGNLYTPCEGSLFSSISTQYLCVNAPRNSARLPAFHQLDLRVDKRWTFPGWSLGAYLDLINAYNRTNPDFITHNYDYSESRPQTGSLPIVPSLGIRGEF